MTELPKYYPAQMEGIMSPVWVAAMSRLKFVNSWITPYIRISSSIPKRKKMLNFLKPYLQSNLPTIVQIMGNNPKLLEECASKIIGFEGINGINLNFACPSRRVINKKTGGGMLKFPEKINEIICRVRNSVPKDKLSVKIRSGYKSTDELKKIIPALNENISFIILHFRTVEENYRTVKNPLSRIKTACELCGNIKLIANGDIKTPEDAENMFKKTDCYGIAVGRGLLYDPAILKRINGNCELCGIDEARELLLDKIRKISEKGEYELKKGNQIEIIKMIYGEKSKLFNKQIKKIKN